MIAYPKNAIIPRIQSKDGEKITTHFQALENNKTNKISKSPNMLHATKKPLISSKGDPMLSMNKTPVKTSRNKNDK